MNYEVLSIRYGEISLKGNNKRKFYDQLFRTVKNRLRAYPDLNFEKHFDHITIRLNGTPYEEVADALRFVFGIQMLRAGVEVEKSLEAMKAGALEIVKGEKEIQTFKISSRRKDKSFPHPSFEINDELGGYILSECEGIKVDVHHPDLEIKVEVKHHHVNLFGKAIKGAGGMPVGTSGKVMLMLSGGIDSPVAGFQLLKRGAKIEGLHFHSPPYTSDRAKQKVIDLARRLKDIGGDFKLH
ncbi:MAG TPA: THUMP domain-containing protein, partial [Candidatus Angelobacter sp.]|nr:THUMP domain-containing protein [Candidatus Angelobacter sp.]